MTTLAIINSTINARPEGEDLLKTIVIKLEDVQIQYHNCEFFQSVLNLKFNLETLKTKGYSLQEILDNSDGIVSGELHKFVLNTLQTYIAKNK